MAAYKETPRQKMIAMMYLVLTALLALNVSKEVIDAFAVVNESLEKTNKNYSNKIDQIYTVFENKYKMNEEKVGPYWEKAKQAKQYSDEMKSYLEDIRDTVIVLAEGGTLKSIRKDVAEEMGVSPEEIEEIPLNYLKKKDRYDKTTHYFVPNTAKSQSVGKAQEIRKKFLDYREKMLGLMQPENQGSFQIGPDFDADYVNADGVSETWETHNFYHTIMAADVTILNKLITEVQNSEFDVVNYLYSNISEEDFKFTNVEAKVIPDKGYILEGGEYSADVIVAAYDTTQRPEVYIQHGVDSITDLNRATRLESTDDIVNLSFPADEVGEHKYAGVLRIQEPGGLFQKYYFNDSYSVGRKSATVSADKMNVFYQGVPNPVSISVPGIPVHQMKPSIDAGTITSQGNGRYTVNIPGEVDQSTALIRVNALLEGEETFFDEYAFRIKRIPDPIPSIGGVYTSGEVERDFLTVSSIIAKTPDFFEFDYTFPVIGFVMYYTGADGYPVELVSNTNQFTPEMRAQFERLRTGSRIQFERIRVKAPEGERELENVISIKIN